MNKLIVLSIVSMNEPTKETRFEYILSDKNSLEDKINNLKKRVFDDNIKEFKEIYGTNSVCPYINCDTYLNPNFEKSNRIEGIFSIMDDIFLIEQHTSYVFAYGITVVNLNTNNQLILYEH
ncbi:hypothetical protein CE11_01143 [Megavirus courdo11]|uniref:Uncharacterized protein n=2 Tax=Megavirus chilense TaxID=3060301 RepID=L7Y7P8_9VIRU|nr:hypothetical protein CE11_01143 [Megavirus courdo11]AGD93038.1 hypothetical protein LBA_01120 [Megavirus lba]